MATARRLFTDRLGPINSHIPTGEYPKKHSWTCGHSPSSIDEGMIRGMNVLANLTMMLLAQYRGNIPIRVLHYDSISPPCVCVKSPSPELENVLYAGRTSNDQIRGLYISPPNLVQLHILPLSNMTMLIHLKSNFRGQQARRRRRDTRIIDGSRAINGAQVMQMLS